MLNHMFYRTLKKMVVISSCRCYGSDFNNGERGLGSFRLSEPSVVETESPDEASRDVICSYGLVYYQYNLTA